MPQPQKRPRCSFVRFCAELPNECWQADTIHWALADGSDVEVLNFVDDHSRYLVASRAFRTTKGLDVVDVFQSAAEELGVPASVLTDNGAIFNSETRRGKGALETLLAALGATYKHSPALPPPDLRQGGALPPDPETVAGQAARGRDPRPAPGPAGLVPGLLQQDPPAPGPGPAHPSGGLRRSGQAASPRPPPSPSATTACAGTASTRRAR